MKKLIIILAVLVCFGCHSEFNDLSLLQKKYPDTVIYPVRTSRHYIVIFKDNTVWLAKMNLFGDFVRIRQLHQVKEK